MTMVGVVGWMDKGLVKRLLIISHKKTNSQHVSFNHVPDNVYYCNHDDSGPLTITRYLFSPKL